MKDKRLDGLNFKIGLAVLFSMGLAKLNGITPSYLEGAIQNAQNPDIQKVAELFYYLATNSFTSFIFNTPHFEVLPEDTYGFKNAFMLINFIITYTPVFLLLIIIIPKIFSRKKKQNKETIKQNNKTFTTRIKVFIKGVKLSFKYAFIED